MPRNFRVFFKTGETITVEVQRFRIEGERLILYSRYDEEMSHAFISLKDVSAIVPLEFHAREHAFVFRVYLREHSDPVEIPASAHQFTEAGGVEFYYDDFHYRKVKMDDVFILHAEVLAIVPEKIED